MDLRTARTLSPREYHQRRAAALRKARETLRRGALRAARDAIPRLAKLYPALRSVYLFGSLLRPGRFHESSDIDVAVECDDLEVETPFARALEGELHRSIDLRPLRGAVADAVREDGEKVYG